jgi:cell wall-associated NlpC family hydrolase
MSEWFHQYVGLPFGESYGEVTCWSLVRRVYADNLGILLPEYGEISATDLVRVSKAMEAGKDDGWQAVDDPQAFDVCIMRAPRGREAVSHVGVMIDAERLLHVEAASAAVVVPVKHVSVAGRILGYRRRA